MNLRLKKVYKKNLQILESIIGLEIKSAIEEQYFFAGKLDKESRGTLKLEFSNGETIIFNCDADGESLNIRKGGFADKGTLETDFEDNRFKWKEKVFLSKKKLVSLGVIKKIGLEISGEEPYNVQSGCKIYFQNREFLRIWTMLSDKIFYRL